MHKAPNNICIYCLHILDRVRWEWKYYTHNDTKCTWKIKWRRMNGRSRCTIYDTKNERRNCENGCAVWTQKFIWRGRCRWVLLAALRSYTRYPYCAARSDYALCAILQILLFILCISIMHEEKVWPEQMFTFAWPDQEQCKQFKCKILCNEMWTGDNGKKEEKFDEILFDALFSNSCIRKFTVTPAPVPDDERWT